MSKKNNISNERITSFGGCDFAFDVLRKRKLFKFFESRLGERHPRAEYSRADGLTTLLYNQLCGGIRTENIKDHAENLSCIPFFGEVMSPDTILNLYEEMSVSNQYFPKGKSKKKPEYENNEVNVNDKFNELLIDACIVTGRLIPKDPVILDFDCTHIETKVSDGRWWFDKKGQKAYCPAVASINRLPVYIENRNGDSNSTFRIVDVIRNAIELLKQKGISISYVRIDAAGYNTKLVSLLNSLGVKFVIRAPSSRVNLQVEFVRNWNDTILCKEQVKVGEDIFYFGKKEEETRIIIKEVTNRRTGANRYWGIITNDFDGEPRTLMNLYAQRGDSENLFRDLKEFGWKILPKRKFEHNTTYLYLTALNYILLRFLTRLYSTKFKKFSEFMLLKTFRDKFLIASARWVNGVLRFEGRFKKMFLTLSRVP